MTTNNLNNNFSSGEKENKNFKKGNWMTPLILILSVIAFIIFLIKNTQ